MIRVGLARFVSRNVFLYKIWFYSIRRRIGDHVRLPTKYDDFYFDGYPRSGNTFLSGLLKQVYPQKCFSSHLHSIAGVKIALKCKLPVVIIVREPKDAVISNLYRKINGEKDAFDQQVIDSLLISYHQYYMFIKRQINVINVLVFVSFINEKILTIEKIAAITKFKLPAKDSLHDALATFQKKMKKKELKKDTAASSLPNDDRAKFKKEYEKMVINSPYYNKAMDIYKELIKYDLISKEETEIE